jgi:hypothetical protein
MRIYQALHDSDEKNNPPVVFRGTEEAKKLNEKGYGIFGTVNSFHSWRVSSDLERLNFWYCEIDKGTKEQQMGRIKNFLRPTFIVESKNGYHCYWGIKQELIKIYGHEKAVAVYREINKRIVKKLDGDTNPIDVSRILRVPGFYHCKNPNDRFMVKKVFYNENSYTINEMLLFLPDTEKTKAKKLINIQIDGDDFWAQANRINCMDGLIKLSGTDYVNGEEFDFIPDRGKFQISVNGKRANCWIDEKGMIGSSAGAGPTIVNWLSYYNHDMATIAQILKDVFNLCEAPNDLIIGSGV